MFEVLDRYAPVTDLPLLKEYSLKPLRKAKRVNTLKSTIKEFEQWAKESGWQLSQVPWCAEGFWIEREDRELPLGKDLLHLLGHTYIQEPASMLPVTLLDPQPGEAILDMSAAPGSKTTQIAARMGNRGVIVANDVQDKRLWALASNLQRCGVVNTVVLQKVGQWYAKHMSERFDRVLVDAPCTAQGTCRKDSDALKYCGQENIDKMARLQIQLLEAAIHATKVGGRIVYSTCTLTWEENEMVIAHILNKFSDQVSAQNVGLGDFSAAAIENSEIVQKYLLGNSQLATRSSFHALRLWPQTFDSEGFFACVLTKKAPTRAREKIEFVRLKENLLEGATLKKLRGDVREWFGTDFMNEDEVLLESPSQIFLTTDNVLRFRLPTRNTLVGLPYGKRTKELTRISHEVATLRGLSASDHVRDIAADDLRRLLAGENLKGIGGKDGDALLNIEMNGRKLCVGRGLIKEGDILNRLPRDIVRMHT